jgi:hypothetical protein
VVSNDTSAKGICLITPAGVPFAGFGICDAFRGAAGAGGAGGGAFVVASTSGGSSKSSVCSGRAAACARAVFNSVKLFFNACCLYLLAIVVAAVLALLKFVSAVCCLYLLAIVVAAVLALLKLFCAARCLYLLAIVVAAAFKFFGSSSSVSVSNAVSGAGDRLCGVLLTFGVLNPSVDVFFNDSNKRTIHKRKKETRYIRFII